MRDPTDTDSISSNRYFLTFIDDYSRTTFALICLNSNHYLLKIIQIDESAFSKQIVPQNTSIIFWKTLHTPEQNGLAKRINRAIVERTRSCMLYDTKLRKLVDLELIRAVKFIQRKLGRMFK